MHSNNFKDLLYKQMLYYLFWIFILINISKLRRNALRVCIWFLLSHFLDTDELDTCCVSRSSDADQRGNVWTNWSHWLCPEAEADVWQDQHEFQPSGKTDTSTPPVDPSGKVAFNSTVHRSVVVLKLATVKVLSDHTHILTYTDNYLIHINSLVTKQLL